MKQTNRRCNRTGKCTRHHVIPRSMDPVKNVTIPLCNEHKDITHHVIKQFYFPKKLRNKLGKAKKHVEDSLSVINSIKRNLDWNNTHKSTNPYGKNRSRT